MNKNPLDPGLAARALAVAALVMTLVACGQVELVRLYLANSGTEARLSQELPVAIPFREHNGWVIVQASVNGSEPLDFVLDSGASMLSILTSERTDALGFDMSGVRRLGSADNLAAPNAAPQRGLDIAIGPLTLVGQTALAIPGHTVKCRPEIPDPPFQGVLGYELFHRYVVEFDYDRQQVVLHDPASYAYRGPGQVVAADIRRRQPYVDVQVIPPEGEAYVARLHVDSGAGMDLSLFPQTSPSIVVPSGGKEVSACFVGGEARYHVGSEVGLDLGGGAVTTPVMYSIGGQVIERGQHGRLGSRFLSRHKVVFDYSRGQVIFEPRAGQVAPKAGQGLSVRSNSASASPHANAAAWGS